MLVDAPATTVTEAGADRMVEALSVKVTTAPPAGALPESVTVHKVLVLDASVVSAHERAVTPAGGWRVSVADTVVPLRVAVRVAVCFKTTVPVEMLNVPVVTPDATVTDAGAAKAGDALLVNVTAVPPAGAATEIVTVHNVLWFESTVVKVQERAVTPGTACNESVAVAVLPYSVPVRVAVLFVAIVPVEIVKVPETEPAATVTDAGAVNVGDALLVRVTTAPPVNAAFESVAVQVVLAFEGRVVKVQASPRRVGGVTSDSLAVAVVPFSAPVRVAVWLLVIVPVEILNVPVVAPAATVTVAGAVTAADALLVRVTTTPPAGATCEIVALHCVLPFEVSVVAVQLSPVMVVAEPETLAVPPVAESVRADAVAEAAWGFWIPIAALVTPGAKVSVTVATVPLGMRSSVFPATTQVENCGPHVRDLFAAASMAPGATEKVATALLE